MRERSRSHTRCNANVGRRNPGRFLDWRGETRIRAAARQARSSRARARDPRFLGAGGHVRAAARAEPRQGEVELLRRPRDREQDARGAHGVGADAEGRLPALQGAARLRPALPERLRLPGALDRGRRRAPARPQLEARDRGIRPRGVRRALPRGRRLVGRPADQGLHPARHVDGLGQRLLHLQRHQHRVRLADAEDGARARLALPRPPSDRVVPALRHVDLRTRARRQLRRPRRPVALRAPAAPRPSGRVADRLDDDAVDAARERRRGGQAGRRLRPPAEWRVGRGAAVSRRVLRRRSKRLRAGRLALSRARSTTCRPVRPSSTA